MHGRLLLAVLGLALAPACAAERGEADAGEPMDLDGVYRAIPADELLPGDLAQTGSPEEIPLLPAAAGPTQTVDGMDDPADLCQPIGPFRMMARDTTTIEIVPALAHGRVVMLFENIAHGHMRLIFTDRNVPDDPAPTWNGTSVGHWENDTFVVETVGFNERTWLNDAGAQHSDELRLLERIRPVLNGQYLEYVVTADDAGALTEPYSYTRYYERVDTEIQEHVCDAVD